MTRKTKKVKEQEIVDNVFQKLKKTLRTPILLEVPMIGRVVDLAYLQKDQVFTIEFKIKDLKKAVAQAKDHLLGADYVYICIPPRQVPPQVEELLKAKGIGLLFYMQEEKNLLRTVIRAKKSKEIWPALKTEVLDYIRSGQKKHVKN